MPWKIEQNGTEYCVVTKDGATVKCHTSEDDAKQHMKALYANVDEVAKELIIELLTDKSLESIAMVAKEGDKYNITVVSTAAIPDRENETFTIPAIDYDIAEAYRLDDFPEFRVFHKDILGIGTVTKMRRVGIFAIDEGESYTDKFSLAVCKELSDNNDGKWRASRGFKAIEVEMSCPRCDNALVIHKEHMYFGFRCPACEQVHLSYKGMPDVRYVKARTFDVTVTDVPAVPMTSASAVSLINISEEYKDMDKKQALKDRLLKAGIPEDAIDSRLNQLSDEQLKEMPDDVPEAVLKENLGFEDAASNEVHPVYLDELVEAVAIRVKEELANAELEISDMNLEVELPEFKEADNSVVLDLLQQLKEQLDAMQEVIDEMALSDEERLKELNTPNARKRLAIVHKGGGKKGYGLKKKAKTTDMEDDEDDEDMVEKSANGTRITKEMARQLGQSPKNDAGIKDGQGNSYSSMTELVQS